MRRSSVALISLIGPLILGACTDRDSTAPRGITPGQPNAAVLVAASTCDGNAIKAAQRAYFTSNQDPVAGYVSDMLKAYGAGQYSTANDLVYAIGRQVAKERLTSFTTDATSGGIFLIDVLRCLTNTTTSTPETLPDSFVKYAARVVSSGIWEIRGGTTNATVPAAGRVIDNTTHIRAFGEPRWGVELATTTSTWGASEHVVFGYPIYGANIVIGSPANINTNEVAANAFELGTIPVGAPKAGLRVGECVAQSTQTGVTNRIVHNNAEILDFSALTALCSTSDPNFVASAGSPGAWYASLLHRAGSLLAPKFAFAQGLLLSTGGLPSDWSPFSTDAITASTIMLSFVNAPRTNTTVGASETVIVHAAIGSVPVPGVTVTISITGNSGQPAGATFDNGLTTKTGVTGTDGNASITYSIGKAGFYTLVTSGSIDGYAVGNTLNSGVNVKNP